MGRKTKLPLPAAVPFRVKGSPVDLAKIAVDLKKITKDEIVSLIQKLGGNDKGPISECIKTLSPEGLKQFVKEMEKLNV